MGDFSAPMNSSPAVNPAPPRAPAFREDCWTEEATGTLVDAWGRRYLELNRGNLRQKDWQEVADAVNSRHGHTQKQRRSDIQCKNRIDTIKKKYKAEKARVLESGGAYVSSWRFFDQLDMLIGQKKAEALRKTPPGGSSGWSGVGRAEAFPRGTRSGIGGGFTPPMAIALDREASRLPEAVAVTPLKRISGVDDSFFRRNYSAMAAAAAKEEAFDDEDESEDEEQSEEEIKEERRGKEVVTDVDERGVVQPQMDGTKMIAMAIDKFSEMYEKVELEKLRQFKEIEHRRIDVGRDVELQRMQLLMDTQVQLEKLKRKKAKKKSSGLDDICSS